MIGHVEGEGNARKFSEYLYVKGIENELEMEKKSGTWGIWIHSEEDLARAREILEAFLRQPDDPQYGIKVSEAARELREKKAKDQEAFEKRQKSRRELFRPLKGYSFGPLTYFMIFACVLMFFKTKFGTDYEAMRHFYISEYDIRADLPFLERMVDRMRLVMIELRHGEYWRLLTPVFMHGGFLHILFNMMCLADLGSMIEGRQGTLTLAILTVALAVFSNLAQYLMAGPGFCGMSGVVYGLFGYIWIRGKFDPASGLFLHKTTVNMMLIWFVFCLTGLMNIANWAHAGGLALGTAWGYLSSLVRNRK